MSIPYLSVTHALAAYYGWRCDHGKRRDEACDACVASLRFDVKYRPKHVNRSRYTNIEGDEDE